VDEEKEGRKEDAEYVRILLKTETVKLEGKKRKAGEKLV
jgi:hypothetical protein